MTDHTSERDGVAWRFDIENAPRGSYRTVRSGKGERKVHEPALVIVAAPDGRTVTVSRWIPDESRWNMLGKNETPLAWMPFPTHPDALSPRKGGSDE